MTYSPAEALWIGGSPCSGKSSIAKLLATRYDLTVCPIDEIYGTLEPTTSLEQQPYLYAWRQASWDERWMQPETHLFDHMMGCYSEQLEMVLQALANNSSGQRLLIEGCSLLPDRVAEIMAAPAQGIWIVPTESFQRAHYRQRGAWVNQALSQCADPERAYDNWMRRDAAYARWVQKRCAAMGLYTLTVSGQRTIAENTEIAAQKLGLA